MSRLAIVLSHPTQYYSPWFRWMARQTEINLKVFYLWDAGIRAHPDEQFNRTITWDIDLLSGYEHEFIPNVARQPSTSRFFGLNNPSLKKRLDHWKPQAILIFGYAYYPHLRLIFSASVPLIFRGDSHLLGSKQVSFWKRKLLHFIYRKFAAITYVGEANRHYFRTFGVPESKLHFVPHCVNAEHFRVTPAYCNAAEKLRSELNLTSKKIVLFAGKLVPAKQPRELLEAFLTVASDDDALVIIGDGKEKPRLIEMAARHPDKQVRFLPFANQSEMPVRYLLADLFVLPSRGYYETWGLAVNEAMHMGVPCLVSDRVGCQQNLVIEGKTGWVFSIEDHNGLAKALSRALAELSNDPNRLKARIAQYISGYTYQRASENLRHAINSLNL